MEESRRHLFFFCAILSMMSSGIATEIYSQDLPLEESRRGIRLFGGSEATLLKTYFEDPTGLQVLSSDGVSREQVETLAFRSDMTAGYRLWLGARTEHGIGVVGSYWAFQPRFERLVARPPANGFGEAFHPVFGDIDIGSTVPSELLTASNFLKAQVAQGELTYARPFEVGTWNLGTGVEYARLDQGYRAELTNSSGMVGLIDHRRNFQGAGPTVSLGATLELFPLLDLFGNLRSSLLFGSTSSHLRGGEDLDLIPSLTTIVDGKQDDFLTRFQGQFGSKLHFIRNTKLTLDGIVSLEAQQWIGAGSPTKESGSLGLFGLSCGTELQF